MLLNEITLNHNDAIAHKDRVEKKLRFLLGRVMDLAMESRMEIGERAKTAHRLDVPALSIPLEGGKVDWSVQADQLSGVRVRPEDDDYWHLNSYYPSTPAGEQFREALSQFHETWQELATLVGGHNIHLHQARFAKDNT